MTIPLFPSWRRRCVGLVLTTAALGSAAAGCTFNLVKVELTLPKPGGAAATTTQPTGLTAAQEADLDRLWSASHE